MARKTSTKSKSKQAPRSTQSTSSRANLISHFTPSLMTSEVLERITVGREDLLARLVEYFTSSVESEAKQFTLLIAPRGFGKSHLVALTYYRLKAKNQLTDRMLIAWLREEEWGITSFLDLLLRIFRSLGEEYPDLLNESELNSLYELKPADAEAKAGRMLRDAVGSKTLILLMENLDDVFAGLGDNGQKRWRAYLQENPFISILATSTGLFNGVSRRTSSFFGFFRVIHLDPLTFEEAVKLLERLALHRDNEPLAQFIVSPAGRARIRAVHLLAGGTHRIYVIFSQFLSRQSLDELIPPFFALLDELTPYYQSRMQLLSPQQRKIIDFMVDYGISAPVKTIAQRGLMSPQTASSQLSDLQEKGYVRATKTGRESLYELREPLMRIGLQVKKGRGKPIQIFVEFLRIWYSSDELHGLSEIAECAGGSYREYIRLALEEQEIDPKFAACLKAFEEADSKEDWETLESVTEELLFLHENTDIFGALTLALTKQDKWSKFFEVANQFVSTHSGETRLQAIAWAIVSILSSRPEYFDDFVDHSGLSFSLKVTIEPELVDDKQLDKFALLILLTPLLDELSRNSLMTALIRNTSDKHIAGIFHRLMLSTLGTIPRIPKLESFLSAETWAERWVAVMADNPDYEVTRRLLTGASAYLGGRDQAFQSLLVEERDLILDAITGTEPVEIERFSYRTKLSVTENEFSP